MKNIKVVELFAGVGGFRIGLESVGNEEIKFETVFASQYEPARKNQFAYSCYEKNFGNTSTIISNEDIAKVDEKEIPKHDLLVGGFPCQDYSVATTKAKGLQGKKGVLWWEIYRIIKFHKTKYLLLENVDRLLKSPSNQRGRDFAIMLKALDELNYDVDWQVINAADYGFGQKRRRVFIFAKKRMDNKELNGREQCKEMPVTRNFFEDIFPSQINEKKKRDSFTFNFKEEKSLWYTKDYEKDIEYISMFYNFRDNMKEKTHFGSMFRNSGIMRDGKVKSYDVIPNYIGNTIKLGDILEKRSISRDYFLTKEQDEKMKNNRAGKKIPRKSKDGHEYMYTEGSMKYPDPLDVAGRTMLTSEGTVNRSSHIIMDYKTNKKRFITPLEAERLNQFPDNWTEGMSDRERYFCMGNALVTGIIKQIGEKLIFFIDV